MKLKIYIFFYFNVIFNKYKTKLIIDSYYKSNNIRELILLLQINIFDNTSYLACLLISYDNKDMQNEGINILRKIRDYKTLMSSLLKLHRVVEAMNVAIQCKREKIVIQTSGTDFFNYTCEVVRDTKDPSIFYTLHTFFKKWFPPLLLLNSTTKESLLAETTKFPDYITGKTATMFKMLFGFK